MSKSDTVVPRCLSGTLQPTHNHGTENLETTPYRTGNEEPNGFDHIVIAVEAACARFESLGVTFKKRLKDRKMKFLAFILDPGSRWVLDRSRPSQLCACQLSDEDAQSSTPIQLQHKGN
jgi:hypothetical protein